MSKRTSIIWTLEKGKLQEIVKSNASFSAILKYFGFAINSAMIKILKKRLAEDGVDYSHIKTGLDCNKGRKFISTIAIPLEQILVENSTYNRGHLKSRLLEKGLLKNECSICGQNGEWNGKPLKMILDHENGINNDNRLENLRMVCGNCNCQLDTTNGRNKRKISNCKKCGCVIARKSEYCYTCKDINKIEKEKKKQIEENRYLCEKCGENISRGAKHCAHCAGLLFNKRKVENRPSKEELEKLVAEMPMIKIGLKYGVSDNAVKKWCKVYGIQLQNKQGYWTKLKYMKAV